MALPAVPEPAATVILLRDGPDGLEVLMTERPTAAGFAAGAMVFPGGKVEAGELDPRLTAIREAYEECGLLLARPPGGSPPDGPALTALRARHGNDFAAVLAAGGLEPALDLLVPFAHWITPTIRPRRFNAQFFLAPAPPGQEVAADAREVVEAVWIRPRALLDEHEAGRRALVFVTYMNLLRLCRWRHAGEALAAATTTPVTTITPVLVHSAEGPMLCIPETAGYPISRLPIGSVSPP